MKLQNNVIPAVLTVGELARLLDVPRHRIEYAINSRRIRPMGRAGSAYIYSQANLARIRRVARGRCSEESLKRQKMTWYDALRAAGLGHVDARVIPWAVVVFVILAVLFGFWSLIT